MTTIYPNLIDGELVTTEAVLDVVNPANEQVIGQVPACGAARPMMGITVFCFRFGVVVQVLV